MPFQEININKIIKEKRKNNPEFDFEYKKAYSELDLIMQIVNLRKAKGLSQDDLAKKAGLTQQMVSRIETRKYTPSYKNLTKIAQALDSSLQLVSK